ncbi:unnamed protein product [Notodromas monacha]|uniref:DH domain-containing protein n=1 Tax=Notodromas monacha TaxID=399045 RepID=A0A7R9C0N1_9CRUS|nr:unnamed protein product [Notodromas monacha]CAG0924728.1 unnamed protein product [Notodromas monacha]
MQIVPAAELLAVTLIISCSLVLSDAKRKNANRFASFGEIPRTFEKGKGTDESAVATEEKVLFSSRNQLIDETKQTSGFLSFNDLERESRKLKETGAEGSTAIEVTIDNNFRNNVISSFHDISKELEILAGFFGPHRWNPENTSPNIASSKMLHRIRRTKRSPQFTTRKTCSVSQDTLLSLKKEIDQHALNSASPRKYPVKCLISSSGIAENCEKLVQLIQCGINKILQSFITATLNSISLEKFQSFRAESDRLIAKLQRELNDSRKSVDAEVKLQVDTVLEELQSIKNQLYERDQELEASIVSLCGSEIDTGNIKSAIAAYARLGSNSSHLPQIVAKSYSHKGLQAFDNILKFGDDLPYSNQRVIVYEQLYEQMKKRGDNGNPKILTLLQDDLSAGGSYLAKRLQHEMNNLISAFGAQIRHGDISNAMKEFARVYHEAFLKSMSRLIKEAYANNVGNTENIISFIAKLPRVRDRVVGYPILLTAIKENHGMNGHQTLMVAYRIRETLKNVGDATTEEQNSLSRAKDELPSSIRALFWDSYIHIKSRQLPGNYLGMKLSYRGRDASREVWTLSTCPSSQTRFERDWTVNIHENGRYFTFSTAGDHGKMSSNWWSLDPRQNGAYFIFTNKDNGGVLDSNGLERFWFFGWHNEPCSKGCLHVFRGYLQEHSLYNKVFSGPLNFFHRNESQPQPSKEWERWAGDRFDIGIGNAVAAPLSQWG